MSILEPTEENLSAAAAALARGSLVAIPTETVYGLGGNARDAAAVERIYAVKGRPATDPLICHVDSAARAGELWDAAHDPGAVAVAACLGAALWPGPLTIVCRAHPSLPDSVTGGSGFVGARVPRHPVALALLARVPFPVAAPSANTFGHVSPTTARHVVDDLAARDPSLLVLDGGGCGVGIESTVVKLSEGGARVEVLRRGGVAVGDLVRVLAAGGPQPAAARVEIRDTRSAFTGAAAAAAPMDGPGQLITHYCPRVPAGLLAPDGVRMPAPQASGGGGGGGPAVTVRRGDASFPLSGAVVIDYGGALAALQGGCLAYRDLSAGGSAAEACVAVFDALRWCETVPGAACVVFPLLSEWPRATGAAEEEGEGKEQGYDAELLAAVEDRLFRAASGVMASVQ